MLTCWVGLGVKSVSRLAGARSLVTSHHHVHARTWVFCAQVVVRRCRLQATVIRLLHRVNLQQQQKQQPCNMPTAGTCGSVRACIRVLLVRQ
jgi:hypothetical protein